MVISENCKLVTIYGTGSISALHGISCPVTIPVELPVSTIVTLINKGFKVYEVNPKKKKERILLTPLNARSKNFSSTSFISKHVVKGELPATSTTVDNTVEIKVDTENESPRRPMKSDFE